MNSVTNDKWYALFVATGQEDNVKERIKFTLKDGFKVLVPKRKMRERKAGKWESKIRILFPGYVLLNGQMNTTKYNLIRDIPGVIRLLKNKDGPLEIEEYEISVIRHLTYDSDIIGQSNVYISSSEVVVIDGPLLGMEGCIQSIDKRKGRVKVLITLMGEPRVVELSVAVVQSA